MEQRSSTVATMRGTKGLAALGKGASELRPAAAALGGGVGGATLGVVPGHRLGRQATLAKGFRIMQPPAALPLFDMSVAVLDSLNLMRASVEEEVVLQSTLGVPAHHALACRLEAYGTPFGAPSLHATVGAELTEDDKQFAACLAAPPDFDAALDASFSLQRMASINALQRPAPRTTEAAATSQPGAAAARARAGELLRMPSVHSDRKKKEDGARPDLGNTGGGRTASDAVATADGAAAGAAPPNVSTPEGRAALAAAAAAARPWQLFAGADDAVAALVGVGYLLMRAARFDRRTPRALERLATGLRARSSASVARPLELSVALSVA